MPTVKYYAKKQLPESIFNKLLIQVKKQGRNINQDSFYGGKEWLLEIMYWNETDQGFEYWRDINNKYVNKS